MLHEEFFIDHMDDLKKSMENLPGPTDYKIKMLNLIVRMKIANSLEIIADSLSTDNYHSGVTDLLCQIKDSINNSNH